MITAVTVPRSSGGMYGSGGMSDTSVVSSGLFVTVGPMNGMANPPNWAEQAVGRPADALDRQAHRILAVPVRQRISHRDQGGVIGELDVVGPRRRPVSRSR